jgi:hypothetical protein
MSEKTLNGLTDLISGDEAIEAIEKVGALAAENNIDWAVCGGIAMVIYGSPRLTKDIDIIASRRLPLEPHKIKAFLKQGGENFLIETEKRAVPVDWILRSDEAKKLYQSALSDAVLINEIPIITPEWLVILKYIAGRFKDQEDCIFLLGQLELVNRAKIKELVLTNAGGEMWLAMRAGLKRWYDLADGTVNAGKDEYGLRDS